MPFSPREISIADFASKLGCSVDTSKRWLKHALGRQFVEVKGGGGRHWRVRLPSGEASIFMCRLCYCFDKIVSRKRWASKAMPKIWIPPGTTKLNCIGDLNGVDAFLLPGDAGSLIKQVAEEFGKQPHELLHFSETQIMESIGRFWLMRAAQALQKQDLKLTVGSIADYLEVSVPSLYSKPFSAGSVRAVIKRVENSTTYQVGEESAGAVSGMLSIKRSRPKVAYALRKSAFDRRREAKARCFLCWVAVELPGGGKMASLHLFYEGDIARADERGDDISPPPISRRPRGGPLSIYDGVDMERILRWLETEGWNLDRHEMLLGRYWCSEDGTAYRWNCLFGVFRGGKTVQWQDAAARILAQVSNGRTRRRLIILNPKEGGLYQIPECMP